MNKKLLNDFKEGTVQIKIDPSNEEHRKMMKEVLIASGFSTECFHGGNTFYYRSDAAMHKWIGTPRSINTCRIVPIESFFPYKEDMIEKLRKGKIAILNDYKTSLKELQDILDYAFPECGNKASGIPNFYFKGLLDGYWGSASNTNLKFAFPISDFFKQNNMKQNRFPFALSAEDQHRIFYVASKDFKSNLADKWARTMVLNLPTEVTEDFYKEIRAELTEFKDFLDVIFGKDEYIPPMGTPCLVYVGEDTGWSLRYADGKGHFYKRGQRAGEVSTWEKWMILDLNNLPVTIK